MFLFLEVISSRFLLCIVISLEGCYEGKDERKNKFHPITCHEGPVGEYTCSSTLYLTSAPDMGGW
jgi:hypothetical protein